MKSLRFTFVAFFAVMLLVVSSLIGYVFLSSTEHLVKESLGTQASNIAENAVRKIDTAKYASITEESGETGYYTELRSELNRIREENGLKYLYTMAKLEKDNKTEYIYMVDGMPLNSAAEDVSSLGDLEDEPQDILIQAFQGKETVVGDLSDDEVFGKLISAYVPILDDNGKVIGILGADFDAKDVYALMEKNRTRSLWMLLIFFFGGVVVTSIFSRIITRPLKQLIDRMERVRAGDLTVQFSLRRKDEVGRLSVAFQQMVTDLQGMIRMIRSTSEEIHQACGQIGAATDSVGSAGSRISGHMKETAEQTELQRLGGVEIDRAIQEVGGGIGRITYSSTIVAESSQITARAAEEGEARIREIQQQMESVASFSNKTAEEMKALVAGMEEVRGMVDVIRNLSGQTNLLALNAAIEAARAGEQGRGFTVVAEQIRKLSTESQASVDKISATAEEMAAETEKVIKAMEAEHAGIETGLSVVRETKESFIRILEEITRVSEQAQEVSAISQEVAAGSEEVESSVGQLVDISHRTAERVQEVSVASDEQARNIQGISAFVGSLEELSGKLNEMIRRFKV